MANCDSRIYYQKMKYFITFLTVITFLLIGISLTIQNQTLFHFDFSPIQLEDKLFFINQSSLTYHVEQTKFYPHLPVQIYTTNRDRFLQLKNKTKKLILLANPMLHMPTWSLKFKNKTNSGNMSELCCSFLNDQCEITNDVNRFQQADAVVYHARDNINRSNEIMKYRHSAQRFVFALWESPYYSLDYQSYNDFFNWTMTYRLDSHIFASYYSEDAYHMKDITSDYQTNEEKIVLYENIDTTVKWGTAAALISNCGESSKKRWSLVQELQKYVNVTIYGKCGLPCPASKTNETIDCRAYIAKHYYFFLVFENNYCQDYTTEKFFSTISLPTVPVVYGRTDYTRFIPQSGFIDIRQFSSVAELGNRLNQIQNNLTLYQEYFQWKRQFIWNRFTHYMTPFCDLCLRLHLDTTPNIIHNVHKWWFHKTCE